MTMTTQKQARLTAVPMLLLAGLCAIALGRVATLVSPLLIALILVWLLISHLCLSAVRFQSNRNSSVALRISLNVAG